MCHDGPEEFGDSEVGSTTEPCEGGAAESEEPEVYDARWGQASVPCGNRASMVASTRNIPADTSATFTIKKTADDSVVSTVNVQTQATQFSGEWVSKKPDANWNGPEIKFTAEASGQSDDTDDPQLSFHRYANIARASRSGHITASGFGWDKKLYIEFTGRTLILHVKVRLLNRTQAKPEQNKKEEYGDYVHRCEEVPIGAAVPDAVKQQIKTAVETVHMRRLDLHRHGCARGDACDCNRDYKCCKFEMEVHLDFVEAAGAMVHDVNLWPGTGRANSANWHRIESRPGKSWAHEVGHLIGFYDEYASGAVDTTAGTRWRASAPASIMGSGTTIYDYHLEEFRAWLSSGAGEQFDLISR